MENVKLSEVEGIKERSRYLRGTLRESLSDSLTGALCGDDQQLIKFHGTYQQQDRSVEKERKHQKLEPLYSFMIRVRIPAGVLTPTQWLGLDSLADEYGIGTIKCSTRQAVQLHGVLKRNLKKTMRGINAVLLDSIAACGDVNRNVMASAFPDLTRAHGELHAAARAISAHLVPKTTAYHEIWLSDEPPKANITDEEPIYGKTYLPRKFKIALAIPPVNDTDIFANDIGLAAIVKDRGIVGYNVYAGGGMGTTFGMSETFPRLASSIGYIPAEKVVDVCEKIVLIQRDNGNRSNRKLSRLKYTIEKMSVAGFKTELENRLGCSIEKERPIHFTTNADRYGWLQGEDGKWHLTLFIEGGRVKDTPQYPMKTGLRELAKVHTGQFILTGNQNLVIANVPPADKANVEAILEKYGIIAHQKVSKPRALSLACVALPMCPLAFADAERYLPSLMDKIDVILEENGLKDTPINIRMTGCPNGCARPWLGEIGFVGRTEGVYNLYFGASHNGDRLNTLYKEMLKEGPILDILREVLGRYAKERQSGEHFGDFVHRVGIV